jgi:RNA-binding protein NOB1
LAVLPYELKVQQPDSDAMKFVTEFAKKTGDFGTLSITDLKVIALTYQLEKKICGDEHLRQNPVVPKTNFTSNSSEITPGFYNPNKITKEDETQKEEKVEIEEALENLKLESNEQDNDDVLQEANDEDEEYFDEDFESEDDDDGGEWITAQNIKNLKKNYGLETTEEKDTQVACITTDFAMQNVLKQIGLKISALDGRIIKEVRQFILRCYTCFKTTPDVSKIFCQKCGHKTLKRVAVSVNENGEQVVHLNPRYKITTKYKNQQVPHPQGGKHATNPIIFEDQRIPHQRPTKKAMQKTDAMDDNYTAGYSPFSIRDLDSRSARLRTTVNIKQLMQNHEFDQHRKACKRRAKK